MYRPVTLDEALSVLHEHPDALVIAGGTDVMVDVNLRHLRPDVVVSLRRVRELQTMGEVFIGAGVTYSRLERSSHAGLAEAARTVGSPQIRAMGTLGGNLGTASPAGDTLPFLVAADAVVVVTSIVDTRRIPIAEFLLGPKRSALLPGEIVVGVELPEALASRQAFSKIGIRQSMVIAIASVCVIRGEDRSTRVAMGAVGPTVLRAPEAERLAAGRRLATADLDEFQRLVREAARPITDHRATAEYRRHAVGVIARRCLERTMSS